MAKLIKISEAQFTYEIIDGNECPVLLGMKPAYINPDKIVDVTLNTDGTWLIDLGGKDVRHRVTAEEWARIEPLLVDESSQTYSESHADEIRQLEEKIDRLERTFLPKTVIDAYQEYQKMLSLTGVKSGLYGEQVGRIMDALAAVMPDRESQNIEG